MSKQLTTKDFIERSKIFHGDKYDYSLVDYKTNGDKVIIICPEHGKFEQVASSHMRKFGCNKCAIAASKISLNEFVVKSNITHNNKYDYSLTKFTENSVTRDAFEIICPIHGIFKQRADIHMYGGSCKKCVNENQTRSLDEFILEARKIHGEFFDYSKTIYKNAITPIIIICPTHGEFEQSPNEHTRGRSCKRCADDKKKLTQEEFIIRAKAVHGDIYDYSKSIYKGNGLEVIIICPIHGEFLQSPHSHLNGSKCKLCAQGIFKGEEFCRNFFETKYRQPFTKTRHSWLKYKKSLELDGYNSDLNLAFEYNGRQHYEIVNKYKMNEITLKNQQERDRIKNNICKDRNVTLVTIKEFKNFHYENIFENIKEGFDEMNLSLDENDKIIIKDILKTI